MKLKLDENGNVVVVDGKPVYVHDDGKEYPFDAAATVQKISQLNGEAKGHRERAEQAEQALKAFEGIENAADARKALEVVRNLDAKKLVDAGEVEKVKAEAIKALEEKYAPVLKERDTLQAQLINEVVGGNFARSKFIAENMTLPPDIVQATFGNAFKVEDGKVVAYDNGNKIYSRLNPGEVAGFDEALSTIIDRYPHRDQILKSSGASGSGAQGGGGQGSKSKSMNRQSFEGMSAGEQMAFVKGGGEITD
ncbi:DUF6651 domain-containing protein [Aquitalea sp. USM4]|uniref:DUF6651 domain-containing protein n=1 Tax=Aquitalea sp. USM4 TaxID=1590041 RepID=UPI00103D26EA|nr:DUF6651 domain-containing protein [Aquitalea sp. USM4]QBJ80520.1 hypothetical protein DKK66_19925 [Aquitalea sp. USM4]